MNSFYGKYLKEREDFEILEDERGFASYKVIGEECYIRDIYVAPESRKSGVGGYYSDTIGKIAKDHGCKFLTATVVPGTGGATESMLAIIRCGFKIYSSSQEKIVLIKEIV